MSYAFHSPAIVRECVVSRKSLFALDDKDRVASSPKEYRRVRVVVPGPRSFIKKHCPAIICSVRSAIAISASFSLRMCTIRHGEEHGATRRVPIELFDEHS